MLGFFSAHPEDPSGANPRKNTRVKTSTRPTSTMVRPRARIALSLLAAFCGACVLVVCAVWKSGGPVDNLAPLGFLLVGTGWLVTGLPLALHYGGERPLPRGFRLPLVGAGAALLAYAIETLAVLGIGGGLEHGPGFFLATSPFVATAGAVIAWVYAWLLRRHIGIEPERARKRMRFAAVTPIVLALGLPFVAWPILEHVAPAWIYDLASAESQARIERNVLESVEIGDPVEKLRARLPQRFSHEIRTEHSDVLGYRWRLEVVDGRIVDVWIGGR